ncbi:hypothetical protein AALO_G00275230 [Alosa alosa]|uniref:Uncharacterized protein n=1 Tax=Alosa alosa TaxID=278164 RepID=A0AAV6FLG8_9TELE|nr:hypothetical protein AALO_G00275230 [Alosa alosa]
MWYVTIHYSTTSSYRIFAYTAFLLDNIDAFVLLWEPSSFLSSHSNRIHKAPDGRLPILHNAFVERDGQTQAACEESKIPMRPDVVRLMGLYHEHERSSRSLGIGLKLWTKRLHSQGLPS